MVTLAKTIFIRTKKELSFCHASFCHYHLRQCANLLTFEETRGLKRSLFKFQWLAIFPLISPLFALFQDCSSDGPGQPSVQETPETKNSFKKKEAQDQGSTLHSQSRPSKVRRNSFMHVTACRHSASPASIHKKLKRNTKPPDNILPHKDSPVCLIV